MRAWLGGAKGTGSEAGAGTFYGALAQGIPQTTGITAETRTNFPWRTAGVFSHLTVRITANDRGASTVNFRKNSGPGNQTISIGASATGEFQDVTHSDTVVAGDTVDYQILTGTGGTTFVLRTVGVAFDAANPSLTVTKFGGEVGGAHVVNTASTTYFLPLTGSFGVSGSIGEADVQYKFRSPVTLRNLCINITANTWSVNATLKTRVNGNDGAQAVSITAGVTGQFEDTTHSDSIAANDLVCLALATGAGTGSFTTDGCVVEIESSSAAFPLIQADGASGAVSLAAAATAYLPVASDAQRSSTTETDYLQNLQMPAILSDLGINVLTNGVTAASVLRVRKNMANGVQAISIGSSATGHFTDAAGRDPTALGDELGLQFVAGATGTSLTYRVIELLANQYPSVSFRRNILRPRPFTPGIGR